MDEASRGGLSRRADRRVDDNPLSVREVLVEWLVVRLGSESRVLLAHDSEFSLLPCRAEVVLLVDEPVGVYRFLVDHPLDEFDSVVVLRAEHVESGSLLLHAPSALDSERAHDRLKPAPESFLVLVYFEEGAESVSVVLAVSVRVLFSERLHHLKEFLRGLWDLESEPVEPVLPDEEAFVPRDGAWARQSVRMSVHRREVAGGLVVHYLRPVRHLLVHVVHCRKHSALNHPEPRFPVHGEDIGKSLRGRRRVEFGVAVGLARRKHRQLQVDSEFFPDDVVGDPIARRLPRLAHGSAVPHCYFHGLAFDLAILGFSFAARNERQRKRGAHSRRHDFSTFSHETLQKVKQCVSILASTKRDYKGK